MITKEEYLKAKRIVQDYESKHLNISEVKKRIIIDTNKVIRVKPRIVKQGGGSLFCEQLERNRLEERKNKSFWWKLWN